MSFTVLFSFVISLFNPRKFHHFLLGLILLFDYTFCSQMDVEISYKFLDVSEVFMIFDPKQKVQKQCNL